MLEKLKAERAEGEKKIQQLENYVKRRTQEYNQLLRNARTRRLIERGALLESMIPEAETLTNEQIKTILTIALTTAQAAEAIAAARKEGA